MAWIKSASNYLPDWIQASDDYRVHARSWAVFFRDGVLIGIVCSVLIASTYGLPTDQRRDVYVERLDLQDKGRAAMEQATKDKAEWCSKHPESPMCRPANQGQGKGDFSQIK